MTITILNNKPSSRLRDVKKNTRRIVEADNTCFDCSNYQGGACAFRLNAPDYLDYHVTAQQLACDNFNINATPVAERTARYQGMETQNTFGQIGLSTTTNGHADGKSHDYRKIIDIDIMSVDALHRLGYTQEQYPVIVATVRQGEGAVFFLPNTVIKTIEVAGKKKKVASNRYDVAPMAQRVAEKGVVKLSNWQHVQFTPASYGVSEATWKPGHDEDSKARLMRLHYQREQRLAKTGEA